MPKTLWTASDHSTAKYVGVHEFEHVEWHSFEILALPDRLLFGSFLNVGFLESGFIMRTAGETEYDTLRDLIADLECFYQDGAGSVSRIVYNDRM